jgi:CRISPR/Cas system-associated protein endoribonuclease Cas2
MKKEIKNLNVKSLIDELNTAKEGTVVNSLTKAKKTVKREYGYKVLFQSGPDFALNRTTPKTNKTLVSIFSKDILYIYDEESHEKTTITKDNTTQLKSFFGDKKAEDVIIENGWVPYAENIKKCQIDEWVYYLKTTHPSIRFLIKRNLFKFSHYRSYYNNYDVYDNLYRKNQNLLLELFKEINKDVWHMQTVAGQLCEILDVADPNTAKYYLDKLKDTSVDYEYANSLYLTELSKYNLDYRRFFDYILFDLYKQGKTRLSINTYKDYLDQQFAYYGKIKEKYPKNLETEHMIITEKVREKMSLGEGSAKFEEIMSETEDYSYHNAYDKFVIVMPKQASDLVDEGQYLCHCVASYVEKVNNGDCTVVFMRKMGESDVPYLTVEILPDRSVPQVEGMNKRSELTEDEISFLNKWAKNKHLKITAYNAIEGRK